MRRPKASTGDDVIDLFNVFIQKHALRTDSFRPAENAWVSKVLWPSTHLDDAVYSSRRMVVGKRRFPFLGRKVRVGLVERYSACELRVVKADPNIAVVVVDAAGNIVGLPLLKTVSPTSTWCDESVLTSVGPGQGGGTAWNDSQPEVRQLLTVQGLRRYARWYSPGKVGPPERSRKRKRLPPGWDPADGR